jgi:hypothetical protein
MEQQSPYQCVTTQWLRDQPSHDNIHVWSYIIRSDEGGSTPGHHAILLARKISNQRLTMLHTMTLNDVMNTHFWSRLYSQLDDDDSVRVTSPDGNGIGKTIVPTRFPDQLEKTLLKWLKQDVARRQPPAESHALPNAELKEEEDARRRTAALMLDVTGVTPSESTHRATADAHNRSQLCPASIETLNAMKSHNVVYLLLAHRPPVWMCELLGSIFWYFDFGDIIINLIDSTTPGDAASLIAMLQSHNVLNRISCVTMIKADLLTLIGQRLLDIAGDGEEPGPAAALTAMLQCKSILNQITRFQNRYNPFQNDMLPWIGRLLAHQTTRAEIAEARAEKAETDLATLLDEIGADPDMPTHERLLTVALLPPTHGGSAYRAGKRSFTEHKKA